jgi:subtilisin family serine protease
VQNTLLVRFEPDTTAAEKTMIVQRLGGRIVNTIAALNIAVVRINPQAPGIAAAQAAATTLEREPDVVYAAPNTMFRIADETEANGQERVLVPIAFGAGMWLPNDAEYNKQAYVWQQISAPAGWNIARGSTGTVIAIIDTGVHTTHPDLQAKLVRGYDFVDGDDEPVDGHGHGTHVAGIAAAISNNAQGVAGTCPNCKLMPVRVLNDVGLGDLVAVAQGVVWAVDHGARVINLSLVGPEDSPALADAMQYAWARGVLPVCAAGNRNSNDPAVYPASSPFCFAVAATGVDDTRASYSNYGPWVAIAAPGDGIYSTFVHKDENNNAVASYEYDSGTSMAAPVVAGAAGILASSGMTNSQLQQRLCSTADPIADTGSYWRCGRLNVYRALSGR